MPRERVAFARLWEGGNPVSLVVPSTSLRRLWVPRYFRGGVAMARYLLALAYALIVCSLFTGPALAQANIGAVRNVVVYAYGTPEGEDRGALFARNRVFARERIETVRSGGLQIEFIDGTNLRLGRFVLSRAS